MRLNAGLARVKLKRRVPRFLLHDFVVMPDHVHLLLTPQRITLERVVQLIKGGSFASARLESPGLAARLH